MAKADLYMFDYQEIAEALILRQGLKEGLWGVAVEFGLAATNVPTGPDGKTLSPAAVNLIQKIGIRRFPEANNLTVDAAALQTQVKAKTTKKVARKK